MKTVEQLATDNAKSSAYVGYGYKGFMCQIHYPELCKIIAEHDKEIINLLELIEQPLADAFAENPKDIASHLSGRLYEIRYVLETLNRVFSHLTFSPPEPVIHNGITTESENRIVSKEKI